MAARGPIARVIDALAACPMTFDALRWVLEAGYRGERRVLRREECAAGRVLDLGCGTGVLAAEFPPERYVGIDPNRRYVAYARRKHRHHRFAVMDGGRLGFVPRVFDTVLISGVIHHLDDASALGILREARRVLREGGRLVAWEDVPTQSRLNVLGRLVHRLDEGDAIRRRQEYLALVRNVFPRVADYPMRSGVCDYVVMVASTEAA